MNPVSFSIPFEFSGKHYVCDISPLRSQWNSAPRTFQVTLNDVYFGIITFTGNEWESDTSKYLLVQKIGELIHQSYSALQAS
jgi:hypothetical protein